MSELASGLCGGEAPSDGGTLGVRVEHVFHHGDKGWSHFRDAPVLLKPWLESVFLSVRRTASSEMDGTTRRTINSFASNCIVQLTRPSGGLLHANAINVAWPRSSNFGTAPGRGRSLNAASSPCSTKRLRMRSTVDRLVCRTAATSSSGRSSAANNRMRARVMRRAEALPLSNSLQILHEWSASAYRERGPLLSG